MAPQYIKTPWSFQRFRKWEWGWSRHVCVCVCVWVGAYARIRVCWSKTAMGSQMLLPASHPTRHILSRLASVKTLSTLDHQGNWWVSLWVIQALSSPPPLRLPWVGFCFSLLISSSALRLKKPSLCLSMFVFSNSSSDKSGKGQAWSFWMKDLEVLPKHLPRAGSSGRWVV